MDVSSIRNPADGRRKPRSVVLWSLIVIPVLCVCAFAYLKFARTNHNPRANKDAAELPILGEVADFALTERDGGKVTLSTLRGHIWIADFIFASCAGTCPYMTERMSKLSEELRSKGMEDVRFVSVSVDPDRDTPEALRFYATLYHASPTNWLFLTGDKKQMEDLAVKSFKLGLPEVPPGEDQILHSSRFFLIDRAGRIRGSYAALTQDEENDLMKVPRDRPMPDLEKSRLISDLRALIQADSR